MSTGDPDGGRGAKEQRFRTLHGDTYADLLRFVERRVSASEAEDVVSTVYLTAWRRLAEVPGDARPWLFGVARKVMANQNRGLLRRRALDVRMVSEAEYVQADGSVRTAVRIDLVRAWRTLSAADREVLALVAFDGLTSEQAATVLGCRRSAFAMRLGRARGRLQKALEPAGGSPAPAGSSRAASTSMGGQRQWTRG